MSDPVFLTIDQVKTLHRLALDQYGGQDGVRDAATLESAVMTLAKADQRHATIFASPLKRPPRSKLASGVRVRRHRVACHPEAAGAA